MSIIIADRIRNMIAIKVPGDFMYGKSFRYWRIFVVSMAE